MTYPAIPAFPPELIATAHPRDLSRSKQFKRGLAQLEQEGVVQILRRPGDDPTPVLAAVGAMQFEVLVHRMANEFGAAVELSGPHERTVRRTDAATAASLQVPADDGATAYAYNLSGLPSLTITQLNTEHDEPDHQQTPIRPTAKPLPYLRDAPLA